MQHFVSEVEIEQINQDLDMDLDADTANSIAVCAYKDDAILEVALLLKQLGFNKTAHELAYWI